MPGQKSGSARWLRGIKSAQPEQIASELNVNGRTVAMPDPGYSDLLISRAGAPRSKIVPASIAASAATSWAATLFACSQGKGLAWLGAGRLGSRSGLVGAEVWSGRGGGLVWLGRRSGLVGAEVWSGRGGGLVW